MPKRKIQEEEGDVEEEEEEAAPAKALAKKKQTAKASNKQKTSSRSTKKEAQDLEEEEEEANPPAEKASSRSKKQKPNEKGTNLATRVANKAKASNKQKTSSRSIDKEAEEEATPAKTAARKQKASFSLIEEAEGEETYPSESSGSEYGDLEVSDLRAPILAAKKRRVRRAREKQEITPKPQPIQRPSWMTDGSCEKHEWTILLIPADWRETGQARNWRARFRPDCLLEFETGVGVANSRSYSYCQINPEGNRVGEDVIYFSDRDEDLSLAALLCLPPLRFDLRKCIAVSGRESPVPTATQFLSNPPEGLLLVGDQYRVLPTYQKAFSKVEIPDWRGKRLSASNATYSDTKNIRFAEHLEVEVDDTYPLLKQFCDARQSALAHQLGGPLTLLGFDVTQDLAVVDRFARTPWSTDESDHLKDDHPHVEERIKTLLDELFPAPGFQLGGESVTMPISIAMSYGKKIPQCDKWIAIKYDKEHERKRLVHEVVGCVAEWKSNAIGYSRGRVQNAIAAVTALNVLEFHYELPNAAIISCCLSAGATLKFIGFTFNKETGIYRSHALSKDCDMQWQSDRRTAALSFLALKAWMLSVKNQLSAMSVPPMRGAAEPKADAPRQSPSLGLRELLMARGTVTSSFWLDPILRNPEVRKHLDFSQSVTLSDSGARVVIAMNLKSDHRRVVAKFYQSQDHAAHVVGILRHLEKEKVRGVTRVIEVIRTDTGTVVIHPFHDGSTAIPCSELQRTIFATKLLRLLANLKKHEVIHGDLRPSNLIFNDKTHELTLIDFDNASFASRPAVLSLPNFLLSASDRLLQPPELLRSEGAEASFEMDAWGAGVFLALASAGISDVDQCDQKSCQEAIEKGLAQEETACCGLWGLVSPLLKPDPWNRSVEKALKQLAAL